MIQLTDLRGHTVFVNADMIEFIEENPDTQIVMTNGPRLYVKESAKSISELVIAYRQRCRGPVVENGAVPRVDAL